MLSRLVIAFLPRSKCLLISWLWSPFAVISEPPRVKSLCFHCFPIYLPWVKGITLFRLQSAPTLQRASTVLADIILLQCRHGVDSVPPEGGSVEGPGKIWGTRNGGGEMAQSLGRGDWEDFSSSHDGIFIPRTQGSNQKQCESSVVMTWLWWGLERTRALGPWYQHPAKGFGIGKPTAPRPPCLLPGEIRSGRNLCSPGPFSLHQTQPWLTSSREYADIPSFGDFTLCFVFR